MIQKKHQEALNSPPTKYWQRTHRGENRNEKDMNPAFQKVCELEQITLIEK